MNEVLKKQENLFREVLAISERQVEFCRCAELESADLSGLMELMDRRQLLMDEIDRLNSSLTPEEAAAGDGRNAPYHPAQNEELVKVMEAIGRNDETCLQLLKESGRAVGVIKQARNHRRRRSVPGDSVYDAWFIDKKITGILLSPGRCRICTQGRARQTRLAGGRKQNMRLDLRPASEVIVFLGSLNSRYPGRRGGARRLRDYGLKNPGDWGSGEGRLIRGDIDGDRQMKMGELVMTGEETGGSGGPIG